MDGLGPRVFGISALVGVIGLAAAVGLGLAQGGPVDNHRCSPQAADARSRTHRHTTVRGDPHVEALARPGEYDLVPGRDRQRWGMDIPFHCVQVGMADPAYPDPQAHLARPWAGDFDSLQLKRGLFCKPRLEQTHCTVHLFIPFQRTFSPVL